MVCLDSQTCERFLNDSLSDGDRSRAQSHLDQCLSCRHLMDEASRNLDVMAMLSEAVHFTNGNSGAGSGDADSNHSVLGRYRVIREIGRGGMGVVYEAEQIDPPRRVALKMLSAVRAGDERAEALFRLEAMALSRVNHTGIATIYDAGYTQDGRAYFAMELVESGETITDYCRRCGLSIDERLRVFEEICEAVHHAHQRGIVHRDLKPSNILISRAGDSNRDEQQARVRIKLLDFGLARLATDLGSMLTENRTPQLIGSLATMSPEQARGEGDFADVQSDVYSLGVILYELVTDRSALGFSQKDVTEAIDSILRVSPVPPRELSRRVCPDLNAVILKALAKDPNDRYESAKALRDEIERVRTSVPVCARRHSPWQRGTMFYRRNRLAVVLGTVAALGLLAGLAVAVWQARDAQQARDDAEQRLSEVLRHNESLLHGLVQQLNKVMGGGEAAYEIASEVAAFYDAIGPEHPSHFEVQRGWWTALRVLCGIHKSRGDVEVARAFAERSLALIEAAQFQFPEEDLLFERAYALQYVAATRHAAGIPRGEIIAEYRAVTHAFARVVDVHPENAVYNALYARNLDVLAAHLDADSQVEEADALLALSDEYFAKAARLDPADSQVLRLGIGHTSARAARAERHGQIDEALALSRGAMQRYMELADQFPHDAAVRVRLADSRVRVARLLADPDTQQEALHLLDLAINDYTLLERVDPLARTFETRLSAVQKLRDDLTARKLP